MRLLEALEREIKDGEALEEKCCLDLLNTSQDGGLVEKG